MKFKELFEIRRNPEMNPHVSPFETIVQYKNNEDVFATFTDIQKVGINPQSSYNTPIGIYSYPIDYLIAYSEKNAKTKGELEAPYRGDASFVTVFEQNGDLLNTKEYNDLENDREILSEWLIDKMKKKSEVLKSVSLKSFASVEDGFSIDELVERYFTMLENRANIKSPAGRLWAILYFMSDDIARDFGTKPPILWSKLLLNVLGYDGVYDPGLSIIHPNEPYQAVHFNRGTLDILKMMENKVKVKREPDGSEPDELMYESETMYVLYDSEINSHKFYNVYNDKILFQFMNSTEEVVVYDYLMGNSMTYDKGEALERILRYDSDHYLSNDLQIIMTIFGNYNTYGDNFDSMVEMIKHTNSKEEALDGLSLLCGNPILFYLMMQVNDFGKESLLSSIDQILDDQEDEKILDYIVEIDDALKKKSYSTFKVECADLNDVIREKIRQ